LSKSPIQPLDKKKKEKKRENIREKIGEDLVTG
jgi:hypothetical protein